MISKSLAEDLQAMTHADFEAALKDKLDQINKYDMRCLSLVRV